ncbi:hypothetical protein AGMMS4956_03020 [Bacteroidia bacterium]|nr:hypothetical protein AGMMS4956_03020 [Bacteroidia bacterium]
MARYLDPKNDLTFKRVFGEHKHLCISLLNSLLPLKEKITSIEYEPTELLPEVLRKKDTVVDVRCKDSTGREFIVEMQMYWSRSFKSRVLFNASKVYVKQLDVARAYEELRPVYSLNLVNDIFEHNMPDEYYHHYKIVNIEDSEKQIEGLEFIFVELPKFKARSFSEKKLQVLWLRFLTEIYDSDVVPAGLDADANIKEALGYVARSAYSDAELATYYRIKDLDMREVSALSDAEAKGVANGEAERAQLQQALAAQAAALAAEKEKAAAALARISELEKQIKQ